MKWCNGCKTSKDTSEFYKHKSKSTGLQSQCKDCARSNARRYHWNNRDTRLERNKKFNLRYKYGLTSEQLEDMKTKQEYRCAICDQKEDLEIDHQHEPFKLRELLCGPCNRALGQVRDNKQTLQSMINYLEKHNVN